MPVSANNASITEGTSDDRSRVVQVQLVAKRTFLEFEVQQTMEDDDCLPPQPLTLKRSSTDSVVDYGLDMDLEEKSTASNSRSSSLANSQDSRAPPPQIGQDPTSEDEELSDEGDKCPQEPTLALAASDCKESKNEGEANSPPRTEQMCYYIALPGSPWWNLAANMVQGVAPAAATSASPSAAIGFRAQAAQFHVAAAQLDAAAQRCEALAESSASISENYRSQASQQEQTIQKISPVQTQPPTTLMLRNIPNDYSRTMVVELLDLEGFAGKYDFVYVPVDFNRMAGLGYAFVNLVSHEDALRAKHQLQGYSQWRVQSQKVCEVCWGEPLQGLEAHIERYRSSPIMHKDMPEECKPILFRAGVRVPFPPPLKRIRPPRRFSKELA